jgi:hypothetical protein
MGSMLKQFIRDIHWAGLCILAAVFFIGMVPLAVKAGPVFETREASKDNLPRQSFRDNLFVLDEGAEYLIHYEELEDFPFKEIFAVRDLDGDGYDEAVIKGHRGGNCCGDTYFVISKRGDQFFTLQTHDALSGWPALQIIELDGKPTFSVRNASEGIGNTSQETTISLLQYKNGEIVLLSTVANNALLAAEVEINSFEVSDLENSMTKLMDADGDEQEDSLTCSYWPRWGAVTCEVQSSQHGLIEANIGCDRIGVLSTSTNGLKDLVCNRFTVLKFNGKAYSK